MARIARIVVPGFPHHIVQRGNRCQKVFFSDDDRKLYLEYLKIYAIPEGIHFWAYCLMDNHVHFIAVPDREDSFACGFAEAHRRYTRTINFREGWRGYLWEGRFKSYVLSQPYLYAATRYVENNPVRAGITEKAWDYCWSSAKAHVLKQRDSLLEDNFVVSEINNWMAFLSGVDDISVVSLLKRHVGSGRPLGDNKFIKELEVLTGRILHKQKPGPIQRRE